MKAVQPNKNPIYIPVDQKLYSTLKIGTKEFPFVLSHDDLSTYRNGFANWHNQREIEISYVIEGSIKVQLLNHEEVFSTGEAFVIFPNHLHAVKGLETLPGRYLTMIFSPDFLCGFAGSYWDVQFLRPLAKEKLSLVSIHKTDLNKTILNQLLRVMNIGDSPRDAVEKMKLQRNLQDLWMELFFAKNVALDVQEALPDSRILGMLRYLQENYESHFSLGDMAAALHVSKGECCRHFKKMMGIPITTYLTEFRITSSIKLLEQGEMNVTEIAHAVGFSSPSNYIEQFRIKTGMTPNAYRKRLLL